MVEVDRGGKSTYHAPGQLVCYPIFDLTRHGQDVKRYCRDLEEALIRTIAAFGVHATRIDGLTGVWLERPPRKIASIGIHLTRWISTHGYALNVDLDPAPFTDWITACGLDGYAFTSLAHASSAGRSQSTTSVPWQRRRSRTSSSCSSKPSRWTCRSRSIGRRPAYGDGDVTTSGAGAPRASGARAGRAGRRRRRRRRSPRGRPRGRTPPRSRVARGDQRAPVVVDVVEADRLRVQAELRPRQLLEQLVECAERHRAARRTRRRARPSAPCARAVSRRRAARSARRGPARGRRAPAG